MIYPINLRSKFIYIPLVLGGLVASFYLLGIILNFLSLFSSIFYILFIAWIIEIILHPLVSYLVKHNVSKILSIMLSFILLFGVLVFSFILVIPPFYSELSTIAQKLSTVNINNEINSFFVSHQLGNLTLNDTFIPHIDQLLSGLLTNMVTFLENFVAVLANILLSFFFAFYYLYEGDKWRDRLIHMTPENWKDDLIVVLDSLSEGLQGFIKGQTILALIFSITVMIAMKILGLDLIVFAGLYVFIAMYFPVVGQFLSVVVPLFIALIHSFTAFIILLIIVFVGQQILLNVIQPRVFRKTLHLHPALVVLAILVGTTVFGVIGAFLALPAVSIVQSLYIHFNKARKGHA